MLGFAILLAFHLIGMLFQYGLHVPLPANVIGLVLFILALFLKLIKLEWVESTALFLNRHMMLFFAPIVVGIVAFIPYFREHAVSILVTLVGSWLAVLLSSGWTAKLLNGNRGTDHPNVNTMETESGQSLPSVKEGRL
jgi:holin-like protein